MASPDLYEVLEVERTATSDELKKAYRRLARQYHPDANPGDAASEARFKEVSQAYEILSDPERRANYDRFGSDVGAGGNPFGAGSVQDIFDMFFGGMGARATQRRGPQPGGPADELPARIDTGAHDCLLKAGRAAGYVYDMPPAMLPRGSPGAYHSRGSFERNRR